MICPRCSVADISPASGACELCGYVPETGGVAVDVPHPDATDLLAREQLAHEFRLDVLLGHGSHSAVFLAREGNSSSYVVLKVLPRMHDRDPQADERFRRAAELVAQLDHPHIVPVNRFGVSDSLFWYTMDHVRARSLREILRSRGPLDLKTTQRVVAQIASALDYAHRRGVVHGNLKPENVLIDPNGWVHVCDALVTRAIERPVAVAPLRPSQAGPARPSQATARPRPTGPGERLPRTSPPAGQRNSPAAGSAPPPRRPSDAIQPNEERRPDYAAPEDQSGFRTAHTDQYTLAVLVHECLTGSIPSAGAAAFEPPSTLASLRPDLPAHVTHAVQRAMNPKPGARFPSVLDFAMALETGALALTDSRPSGRGSDVVLTVPDWQPPVPPRPRWPFALLGIAALAAAAWFGVLEYQANRSRRGDEWQVRPTAPAAAQATPPAGPVRDPAAVRAAADSAAAAIGSTTVSRGAPPPERASREAPPRRSRTGSASRGRITDAGGSAVAPAPAPRPAPSAERGFLSVNATPWGQVYIDGQLVGNTPRANLPLPPGTHAVRIVREGYETLERTVEIAPGETVRLTGLVLQPRP